MLVSLGYTRARATGSTAELKWLNDLLTFEIPRSKYTTRGRKGWDGKVRMFSMATQTMPAGLVGIVQKFAARKGKTIRVLDRRVRPKDPIPVRQAAPWLWATRPDLGDEQEKAVDACLKATRGIVWAATGSGKLNIAVAIAQATRCRTLFLCDDKGLMVQAAKRFTRLTGRKAGVIGDGKWRPRKRFTVALVQTLYRSLRSPRVREFLSKIRVVLADEVHRDAAKTPYRVLQSIPYAYWRIGFSGTPFGRSDGKTRYILASTGGVIWKLRLKEAQDKGFLSTGTFRFVRHRDMQALGLRGTWTYVYSEGVVTSASRNKLLRRIVDVAKKPCLVSVLHVRHGRILANALKQAGWRVEFVWRKSGGAERVEAANRLDTGRTQVIVATQVFNQAIDIPELQSVVNAAGMKAPIALLQKVGRLTRKTKTKTTFEFWDIADQTPWWLADHSNKRIRTLVREGMKVLMIEPSSLKRFAEGT